MNVIWIYHYTLNLQKQFSQFAHFSMWCVLALTPRYVRLLTFFQNDRHETGFR